jgi:hypothetical protein
VLFVLFRLGSEGVYKLPPVRTLDLHTTRKVKKPRVPAARARERGEMPLANIGMRQGKLPKGRFYMHPEYVKTVQTNQGPVHTRLARRVAEKQVGV